VCALECASDVDWHKFVLRILEAFLVVRRSFTGFWEAVALAGALDFGARLRKLEMGLVCLWPLEVTIESGANHF
jgi:hypothetical protein